MDPQREDRMVKAMAWMVFSGLSFAFMGAMVKFSGPVPLTAKVFFRNMVTLGISTLVAVRMGENPLAPTPHWRGLLLRSLAGLGGVFLYFLAIGNMNLADASLLNKTSPFFVTVLAALFLKEKLGRSVVPALLLAFAGALLIIKPTFTMEALPALAGLGSGFFAGLAYTTVRFLGGKVSANRIVFAFCFVSTLLTAPFLLLNPVHPTAGQWWALLGTGVFASGGQYGLTFAYHHARASRISVFTYLHVLFALALGFLFWGERPDAASLAGGILIVAGAVITHRNR